MCDGPVRRHLVYAGAPLPGDQGLRNALLAHRRVKAALLLIVVILLAAIVVTGGYVGFIAGFGVSTQQGGG